ncbi:MAG: hypothetical protein ACYTGS_18470 [Planctomycetota bacterium]|jgi:hypothetical protein
MAALEIHEILRSREALTGKGNKTVLSLLELFEKSFHIPGETHRGSMRDRHYTCNVQSGHCVSGEIDGK